MSMPSQPSPDVDEQRVTAAILVRLFKELVDAVAANTRRAEALRHTNERLAEEVTERERTERKLQRRAAEMNATISSIADGVTSPAWKGSR